MHSFNKTINKGAVVVLIVIIILAALVYYFMSYPPSLHGLGPRATFPPSPTPTVTPSPIETSPSPTPTVTPSIGITPITVVNLNWGGYLAASNTNTPEPMVTSVNGSWVVPSVSVSTGPTFSATWIGIGGFLDTSLIQCGTEQDSVGGQTEYSAWYELIPNVSITINEITVSPGDSMKASIYLLDANTNLWQISLNDLTTSQQFQSSFTYNSSELSAEWIVERPDVNNMTANLADFGTMIFSNCQATIGSVTGSISEFPSLQVVMYQSATENENTQLVNVSNLQDNGLNFTETYEDP